MSDDVHDKLRDGVHDASREAASGASHEQLPAMDNEEWERVVAELTAAMHGEQQGESMPAALTERIVGAGELIVREQSAARTVPVAPLPARQRETSVTPLRVVWQWSGWLAAAAVAVWVVGSRGTSSAGRPSTGTPATASSSAVRPSANSTSAGMRLRQTLLASEADVAQLAWTATKDSSALGAGGDVVWSARAQSGVMRIAGLRPNDRKRWQYQLWIFDKRRDQRYPVDGGVFDIPAGGGEVFVPINARVPVGEAVLFAITVEPAGGVVVSTRERIALLAKAGG